jgi:hypothetical protein
MTAILLEASTNALNKYSFFERLLAIEEDTILKMPYNLYDTCISSTRLYIHPPPFSVAKAATTYLYSFFIFFLKHSLPPASLFFFNGFRLYTRREGDGVMYGNGTLLFNRKGKGFGVKLCFFISHWTREPEH